MATLTEVKNGVRIEKDFLGEKEVPNYAYYGVQTMRAVENFPITGYKIHEGLIKAFAIVKKAAALANTDVGRLELNKGGAIAEAAQEILDGKWHDHFIVDPIQGGAGTSMNMNANEVMANRALELLGMEKGDYHYISPNSHVNMAQSTNDAFPTAIHIATLNALEGLLQTMGYMHDIFELKAEQFDHVIKSRQHLYEVNMGATAVGTGLNADPEYIEAVVKHLAAISELPLVGAEDLVDATQNTDAYTEVSAALKVCMMNMSKIANDLRLMASGPRVGLAEIMLPARQPGSSIIPGKVNPVMPEVINQIAFQVIGNDHTICLASEAGQLELNVMEPVLVFNLLQSISIMNNGFRAFTDNCLKGIEANEDRLKEYVEKSVGIITAVNPHIGYEAAARVAKEAIATGQSVRELCVKNGVLSQEDLELILDPFEMTHPGIAGATLLKKN